MATVSRRVLLPLIALSSPLSLAVETAIRTALYVASSVPQLPALVATFLFTAGARVEPVMVTLLVAAAGVMLQGWTTPREG